MKSPLPSLRQLSLGLAWLGSLTASLSGQVPTDNPAAAQYGAGQYPVWTDSIHWERVLDMSTYANGADHFAKFENARDELHALGGGVLYYPAGTYTFNLPDTGYGAGIGPKSRGLMLKSGVVIRGADLAAGADQAVIRASPDSTSADFYNVTHNLAPTTVFVFPTQTRGTDPATGTANAAGQAPRDWSFIGITAGTGEEHVGQVNNVGVVNVKLDGGFVFFGYHTTRSATLDTGKWLSTQWKKNWPAGAPEADTWAKRVPDGTHFMDCINGAENWHMPVLAGSGRLILGVYSVDGAPFNDMMHLDGKATGQTAQPPEAFHSYRFTGRLVAHGRDILVANNVLAKPTRNFVHTMKQNAGDRVVLFDYANHIGVDINKSNYGGHQDHLSVTGPGSGYHFPNVIVRDNWVFCRGNKAFEIAGDWVRIENNHNERYHAANVFPHDYIVNAATAYPAATPASGIDAGGISFDGWAWQTAETASDYMSRGYDLGGRNLWVHRNTVINTGSRGNDGEGVMAQRHNSIVTSGWAFTYNVQNNRNLGPGTFGEAGWIGIYDMHAAGFLLLHNATGGTHGVIKADANWVLDTTVTPNRGSGGTGTPSTTHVPSAGGDYQAVHAEAVLAPVQVAAAFLEGGRGASITWSDASTNELGFRVDRRAVGGAWAPVAYRPAQSRGKASGVVYPYAGATTYPELSPESWIDYTVSDAQSWEYRVVAINSLDDESTGVSATVLLAGAEPPVVTLHPQPQTVTEGQSVSFTVEASGTAPLSYQWRKDGQNIDQALGATYTIDNVNPGHRGSYDVVVTNSVGQATSNAAVLRVVNALPATLGFEAETIGTLHGQDGWVYTQDNASRLPIEGVAVASGGLVYVGADGGAIDGGAQHLYLQARTGTWGKMDRWAVQPRTVAGPVFFRALVKIEPHTNNGVGTATDPYEVFFGFVNTNSISAAPWNAYVALKIQKTAGGLAGVETTGSGAIVPSAAVVENTTMLLVGKFEVDAEGRVSGVKAWVNPTRADEASPLVNAVIPAPATVLTEQNYFKIRAQNMPARIDALTFASTWNEVVPEGAPPAPPTITAQPQGVTVEAGQPILLSVSATGTPPLSYQWKKGASDLPEGLAASYSISAATYADAGSYTVVVRNGQGEVTSDPAVVRVLTPLPYEQNFNALNSAELSGQSGWAYTQDGATRLPSAEIKVQDGGLSFTGPGVGALEGGPKHLYLGARTGAYATTKMDRWLHHTTASFAGPVYFRFLTKFNKPEGGTLTDPSEVFFGLSDNAAISGAPWDAYLAVKHQNILVNPVLGVETTGSGGTVPNAKIALNQVLLVVGKFEVDAAGLVTGVKAWINPTFDSEGTPDVSGVVATPTKVLANLTILKIRAQNMATWIDEIKFASTWAGVVPEPLADTPPSITQHPQGTTVLEGAAVNLTVAAEGTAPLSYQWRKGEVDIALGTNPSARSATFSIASAVAADSGSYDVVVTNAFGQVTSNPAQVTVNVPQIPPSITGQPQPQSVGIGGTATFNVVATGSAPLAFAWRKGGTPLDPVAHPSAVTATLTLSGVTAEQAGDYDVVVTNAYGQATSNPATLTVIQANPPAITTHPAGQTLLLGSPLNLTVVVSGTDPFTYQWRKNGANIDPVANPSAATATLSIAATVAGDGAAYDVVVTNAVGNATSNPAGVIIDSGLRVVRAAAVGTLGDSILFEGIKDTQVGEGLSPHPVGDELETQASYPLSEFRNRITEAFAEGLGGVLDFEQANLTIVSGPALAEGATNINQIGAFLLQLPSGREIRIERGPLFYEQGNCANGYRGKECDSPDFQHSSPPAPGAEYRLPEWTAGPRTHSGGAVNVASSGTWALGAVNSWDWKFNPADKVTMVGFVYINWDNFQSYQRGWMNKPNVRAAAVFTNGVDTLTVRSTGFTQQQADPYNTYFGFAAPAPGYYLANLELYTLGNTARIWSGIDDIAVVTEKQDSFHFTFNNEGKVDGLDRTIQAANWQGVYGPSAADLVTSPAVYADLSEGVNNLPGGGSYKAGFLFVSGRTDQPAPGGFLAFTRHLNVVTTVQDPLNGVNPQTDWYAEPGAFTANLGFLKYPQLRDVSFYSRPRNYAKVSLRVALELDGQWYVSDTVFHPTDTSDWEQFTLSVPTASWLTGVVGAGSLNLDFTASPPTKLTPAEMPAEARLTGLGVYIDTDDAVGQTDSWVRIDSFAVTAVEGAQPLPPVFDQQPVAVTVVEGQPASFTVQVSSDLPYELQWRKGEADLEGATGATYTIPATTLDSAGEYGCVATSDAGSTTSAKALLTVLARPAIDPVSQAVPANGGTFTVNITAAPLVTWTSASNAAWISITDAGVGFGDGTVTYRVSAKTSVGNRLGTLTVAGRTVTVTQAGAVPFYDVSPATAEFGPGGGEGTIDVIATEGAGWSSASSAAWVTLTAGAGVQSGTGQVLYTVAPNEGADSRTATIPLANTGVTHEITQGGRLAVDFEGATKNPDGTYNVPWLGDVGLEMIEGGFYLWTDDHDIWYGLITSPNFFWAWDYAVASWWWTGEDFYPWVFDHIHGWAFYEEGTINPRIFWVWDGQQWSTLTEDQLFAPAP